MTNGILKISTLGTFLSLPLLCSCASTPDSAAFTPAAELPADIAMNKSAGRGSHLTVTLRLDSGEKFTMFVDTGTPITLLPKSLQPKLGKKLSTQKMSNFGHTFKVAIYPAPKIYFGNTLIMTGERVGVSDDEVGILGMDCLRHYCIQLDFSAGKLRFLHSENINTNDLGEAFPLTGSNYAYMRHGGLFQDESAKVLVDTGLLFDGLLESGLFRRELKEQPHQPILMLKYGVETNCGPDFVSFSKCVWAGNTYTNLAIEKGPLNSIGLMFLARHIVTFDFPQRTIYFKQTSVGPWFAQSGVSRSLP